MPTVLLIDDDEDLRMMVGLMLEPHGYAVTVAGNGKEGLERASTTAPDLILLDIKMPVMSGAEFAAEYRRRCPPEKRARIVVMTAADHAARRAQDIGADDFLAKPFTIDELLRSITRQAHHGH